MLKKIRNGTWIQTYTGKQFYPLDPDPESICIEDIAASTSKLCRFVGHCSEFYSVCQHSVLGAWHILRETGDILLAFEFQMHDAQEGYLADIPRPLKLAPELAGYNKVERHLEIVIRRKYGLPLEMSELVKLVDLRMLATEKRDLMGKAPAAWMDLPPPYPNRIISWSPKEAETRFLHLFKELYRGVQ